MKKTQSFTEVKSCNQDDFNSLFETILNYEIKVQFFDKNFSKLLKQLTINPIQEIPPSLSPTDSNTLNILGLTIQQIQNLPSITLITLVLFNLFSCLLILTHILLFQTASEWNEIFPAYIECSLLFFICVCTGLMFRATRVTTRLDEVLWGIASMFGLGLAFGSVQRLFFYAENLSQFSFNKNISLNQTFDLYTQIPTNSWTQFLFFLVCLFAVIIFYVSSYLCFSSPEISNIVRRYPNLFFIKNSHKAHQDSQNLAQDINQAKSNLRAFQRFKTTLITELMNDPIFTNLHISISDSTTSSIQQIQDQVTYLTTDHLNLEQQQKLEHVQHLLSKIQLLSQDALSLQQQIKHLNDNIEMEKI